MTSSLFASGMVAAQVGLPRWRLLYLIEKGELPGPTHQVPGRRLFTKDDVVQINDTLDARPELRQSSKFREQGVERAKA